MNLVTYLSSHICHFFVKIDNKKCLYFLCRYLHTKFIETNQSDMYAFIDPAATYKLNEDFERYVIGRMKSGSSRIFLMPHNEK